MYARDLKPESFKQYQGMLRAEAQQGRLAFVPKNPRVRRLIDTTSDLDLQTFEGSGENRPTAVMWLLPRLSIYPLFTLNQDHILQFKG